VPVQQTNSIGMLLMFIPPGEFDMGSTPEEIAVEVEQAKENEALCERIRSEGPRHRVKITRPFLLGMYHVTQGEYEKVMGANPSAFTPRQLDASTFQPPLDAKQREWRAKDATRPVGEYTSRHPVETVSWDDSAEFCRRLSAMPAEQAAGRGYRLPTEAEWEYACRAGTTTRWNCGDDEAGLADVAWFTKNAGEVTHPVGQKKPNAWGLYDMHGNVWQICGDWYSEDYYAQSPSRDPKGPPTGSSRVLRGGYWSYGPTHCRSARRTLLPASRSHDSGFRVLCEIAGKVQPGSAAPDDAFIKEVAALPAEQQVARVVAKLKELNPGYDGKEEHAIENGQVTRLALRNTTIKDLSPVRALTYVSAVECQGERDVFRSPLADLTPLRGLRLLFLACCWTDVSDLSPLRGMPLKWALNVNGTRVRDLSPLRGMPLRYLVCGNTDVADLAPLHGMPLEKLVVNHTLVSDLSPLRGMSLTSISCFHTRVTDISPLQDMPLKELRWDFDPKRDSEIVRSIKTLETINGLPAEEFWKEIEAGRIPSPGTGLDKKQE
jgi:formylglycine-generating enzyme required for sulfatase activity